MAKEKKGKEGADVTPLLSGTLNILGLNIDLGELLASPQDLVSRLEELRENLKAAGGREVEVSGHIRTRGISGEREFHVGTLGKVGRKGPGPPPSPAESAEPPIDVFDEPGQVTVVADVPGVSLQELELKLEGNTLSIATKGKVRRNYHKAIPLEGDLEPGSMAATCHNGVLEVRVRKRSK